MSAAITPIRGENCFRDTVVIAGLLTSLTAIALGILSALHSTKDINVGPFNVIPMEWSYVLTSGGGVALFCDILFIAYLSLLHRPQRTIYIAHTLEFIDGNIMSGEKMYKESSYSPLEHAINAKAVYHVRNLGQALDLKAWLDKQTEFQIDGNWIPLFKKLRQQLNAEKPSQDEHTPLLDSDSKRGFCLIDSYTNCYVAAYLDEQKTELHLFHNMKWHNDFIKKLREMDFNSLNKPDQIQVSLEGPIYTESDVGVEGAHQAPDLGET